jgi:hypothetical protein
MEPDPCEGSVEAEFAATARLIDLYLRQKTDLYLQHYVFEPFDFLATRLMYLAVVITLLVAGTLVLFAGVVLLIATVIPLWASLLLTGVVLFLLAAIIARTVMARRIVLKTPTALEMMNRGKE